MDREGFLKNAGFDELVEFVRAGIEFLALQDKRELDRMSVREARAATAEAREDIRQAIVHITRSPSLTPADKARITKAYRKLANQVEEIEEYNVQARRSLTTMSLLGVVAGFMTHETKSLIFDMEAAIGTVVSLAKKHASLRPVADDLSKRIRAFKGQLEYAQLFLQGARADLTVSMSAAGQIRHVLSRFESFASDHDIQVEWEAKSETKTPLLAPAVYSGVILNLYTNALKALLSVTSSIREPRVLIRAWNEGRKHFLEVSDNGIGIPPELRKRVWDPLFTTTSDTGNPLGSGMGLGLSLVRQVVEANGGKIAVADDPPPGFNTTFRAVFSME
jgi:signal transduction histidine kinase